MKHNYGTLIDFLEGDAATTSGTSPASSSLLSFEGGGRGLTGFSDNCLKLFSSGLYFSARYLVIPSGYHNYLIRKLPRGKQPTQVD